MANTKGRGVRVEIAASYSNESPANFPQSVTRASPGVVTDASHGFSNNTVGYWKGDVRGMAQLREQAFRMKNVTTNTFDLQGLNTTNYSEFIEGSYVVATAWETLAEATSYSIPNAESEKLDATTLLDIVKVEEAGLLASQSITVNILSQTAPSNAMNIISAAAQAAEKVLIRITLADGAVRIFYGEPSLPGEDVQRGQLGTGSLSFAGRGYVLMLAA